MERSKVITYKGKRYRIVLEKDRLWDTLRIDEEVPRRFFGGTKWVMLDRYLAMFITGNPIEYAKQAIDEKAEQARKHTEREKQLDEWFA